MTIITGSDSISQFDTRPLYMQVYDRLISQIADGTWKPGDMIPNEIELARNYGVSLGTMRKALQALTERGLLTRRQGRGTFIADHATQPEVPFDNFRDARSAQLSWVVASVDVSTAEADASERTDLSVRQGAVVIRLRRLLRDPSTETVLLEHCSLPSSRFPGLAGDKAAAALPIWRLARQYGLLLGAATETVQLHRAGTAEARLMTIAVGAPILLLSRIISCLDDVPLERRIAYCSVREDVCYLHRTK